MAQINKPDEYFNTKLYTGSATSSGDTQAVTGVGFQPDWVWIKNRDGAYQHVLYDVIRGVNKEVRSSQNIAEVDSGTNGYLSAFNSDGFTTTRGTNTGNHVNANGSGFVSWNWLAGGTASSNTDGSITSNVSANTTSGFSIVSYTGTGSAETIGHGLGTTPAFIIVKKRNNTNSWFNWNQTFSATQYLSLDTTNAVASASTVFGTLPTSSVFSTGGGNGTGASGDTYIAYCFAEKKGFSKFGSYTGNGSTDGTFVYTGFKPAFVLLKNADGTYNWNMQDNKRDTFNPVDKHIAPNLSAAEATSSSYNVDFLSNGFKLRNSLAVWNGNGNDFIYMCFAENPLVGTNNIPATAR